MVGSFTGDPLGSRSANTLVINAGLQTGNLTVTCPECGEQDAHEINCSSFDGIDNCSFSCGSCGGTFEEAASTVWEGAVLDLYDRSYD